MNTDTFIRNAKYAFTIEGEFKKSIQLKENEKVIIKRKVKIYSGNIIARLTYLFITNKRLVLIKHYFFRPDIVISIEFKSIINIELKKSNLLGSFAELRKFSYIDITFRYNFNNKDIRFYCFASHRLIYLHSMDKYTKHIYYKIKELIEK